MKRPFHKTWTPEEEAKLRELWKGGMRGEALGHALGRSPNAADARAALLGLKRTHRQKQEVVSLQTQP
jgi:hypothetical protein